MPDDQDIVEEDNEVKRVLRELRESQMTDEDWEDAEAELTNLMLDGMTEVYEKLATKQVL